MSSRRSKKRRFDYKTVITKFYKDFAPQKVGEVGKVLKHFEGREEDLIETLETKYSVVFNRDGSYEEVEEVSSIEEEFTDASESESEPEEEASEDYTSDEEMDEKLAQEVDFSFKSPREQAADLARSAALIAQSRPKPKRVSKRLSADKKKKKNEKRSTMKRPSLKRTSSSKKKPQAKVKTEPARQKRKSVGKTMHKKDEHLGKPGTKVWVPDVQETWVQGKVISALDAGEISVKVNRKTVTVSKRDVEPVLSTTDELANCHDLTKLPALHEPALLEALTMRFANDQIYTFTGPILLAINPFKRVDIYGTKQAAKYMASSKGFTSSKRGNLRTVDIAPHIYKLADDAYRAMRDNNGANQSMLISGESGAGKTETTKIVLNYLSYVSSQGRKTRGSTSTVSDRILQANPLLEAFGNAKTIRNDNSSRFGKLIQVQFDEGHGSLKGAYVDTYLLEKARVTRQADGERNYHIFYELAAGATSEQKKRWHFPKSLRNCRYTGRSDTFHRDDIDDLAQFKCTLHAMEVLNFSPSDVERIFRGVVAVLHLGNVDFKEKTDSAGLPAAKVVDMKSLEIVAELLEIDAEELLKPLTTRRINIGKTHETVERPLNRVEAEASRDSLAMNLFERIFGWVVWRTNLSIGMDDKQYEAMLSKQEQQRQYEKRQKRRGYESGTSEEDDEETPQRSKYHVSLNRAFAQAVNTMSLVSSLNRKKRVELRKEYMIGCLDIFGFEVFDENSLSQLLINYTNETLQHQFNEFIFEIEQQEYHKEGIDWKYIEFPNNTECIAMIENKPMGLLSLLDEECLYPKGTDESLVHKLQTNLPKKYGKHFIVTQKDRVGESFTIRHFAGDVSYSVYNFCKKNRNELHQEVVDVIRSSKDQLLSTLFPEEADEAAGGADMAAHFNKVMEETRNGRVRANSSSRPKAKASTKLLKTTVSSHFKSQLATAMSIIRCSQPHYTRCLKPNDDNKPGRFDRNRMVAQLRYSGVLELVKVTRAGYPSRFSIPNFVRKFAVLSYSKSTSIIGAMQCASKLAKGSDTRGQVKACERIFKSAGLKLGEDFQIGHTKVFLRQSSLAFLEMKKAEKTFDSIVTIQRAFRKYRLEFLETRQATRIQRNVRGYLVRKEVGEILAQRKIAAELIQTNPHFVRWLDYVMRKARIQKRRRRKHRKRGWTFKPPKWYTKNKEMFWFLGPMIMLYFLPGLIRGMLSMVYHHPAVPFLLLVLLAAMVSGAYSVSPTTTRHMKKFLSEQSDKFTSGRAFANAKKKKTKPKARPKTSKNPTQTKAPAKKNSTPVVAKKKKKDFPRFRGLKSVKKKK